MDNLSDFGSCDLHARALRGILWLGEADTSADQAMRLTSGRPTSHPVVGQRAQPPAIPPGASDTDMASSPPPDAGIRLDQIPTMGSIHTLLQKKWGGA